MIDPKLIRSDPDGVRTALARRGAAELVDEFLRLDTERRRLQAAVEGARADEQRSGQGDRGGQAEG